MAKIKCPTCSNEIDENLKVCIYCGNRFDKKKRFIIKIAAITAIVIVTTGMYLIAILNPSDNSRSHNQFEAYSYAEQFVEKQLKSPSTAEFPGISEKNSHITKITEDKYKIDSWVDSQNGFGAQIRTNFSCTIIFKDGAVSCEDMVFK